VTPDPLWFKQAVIYQLHIKAFYDSNQDGIGDFAGLRQKLDYLESLGITAIWLIPFYPSPLKDDGYDISDYFSVNPIYGSVNDFKRFLKEAHERNIRVITELIINHTSDQHPWFQRARTAKAGSAWRNFYVWSDTTEKYKDARIIFSDFEKSNWTWDPVAQAYYWHRFYSHQPDLNFESPLVQKEILRVMDFWLEMGVDGLRLDAIPYLFEAEGTNCENLDATHQFIKKLRQHMDIKFQDRILLAEANQWPEDAVAYFGQGDECHMAFHFPVMPRLFMAIQMEDRFPIVDILEQTPVPPANCQWAMFLRNHDELTLEMVSDEERDYMYHIYAKDPKARINLGIRRRLAPLLENDRVKIELMNIMLFSLPGTPLIYYGDEIGMGDNYYLGDRNGVRTPMQWNSNLNAGFSSATPQKLYLPLVIDPLYRYEVVNVENQEQNSSSLLWWFRRTIMIRKKYKAFGCGSLDFIASLNTKILAFTRTFEEEIILIVINLSSFPQATEIDLTKYKGYVLHELFHYNAFPPVKDGMYTFTLSPHGYFWLSLQPSQGLLKLTQEDPPPSIVLEDNWKSILQEPFRQELEKKALPRFLKNARWFRLKSAAIQSISITSSFLVDSSYLCIVSVRYHEYNQAETYLVVLSFASQLEAKKITQEAPDSIIAYLQVGGVNGIIYDGIYTDSFRKKLVNLILNHRRLKFGSEELIGYPGKDLNKECIAAALSIPSLVVKGEQSNSSFIYGQKYFLKLYRKLEEGMHPDIEMEKFLTEQANFSHIPQFAGAIEWHRQEHQPTQLAILETVVANEGTGWTFSLDSLSQYYTRLSMNKHLLSPEPNIESLIGGNYLEAVKVLGERTAQMHIALSSQNSDPNFAPVPFSLLYQRSIYQGMRSKTRKIFQLLRKNLEKLDESAKPWAEEVLKNETSILDLFYQTMKAEPDIAKIRIHGDYHLGQVLYTGKDFYIIDFEGEPLATLSVRRLKRSALRDVASMLRSFHYAAYQSLYSNTLISPEMSKQLEPWADAWYQHIYKVFLQSYTDTISQSAVNLVPNDPEHYRNLLKAFLLDKAIYELSYELNMRPTWTAVPCRGILYYLNHELPLIK
jgi:maltose alpha-D-glucosyltransferase/alpha-amylase